MRAIVYFRKDDYINIPADEIEHDCGWFKVYKDDKLVACFGEEIVDCVYMTERKDK